MNVWCQALGIKVPKLEDVKKAKEANTFALMLVALLERGEAMTLDEVARRFDEAGVKPYDAALRSLKRCRPGRPPVHRDGDHYALDPHNEEMRLWAFRLGLRGPRIAFEREPPPKQSSLGGPEDPLTPEELREAFEGRGLYSQWSARRAAVIVLDAHGGRMRGEKVIAFLEELTDYHPLHGDLHQLFRRGSPICLEEDGTWVLDRAHATIGAARNAVRERVEMERKHRHARPTQSEWDAHHRRLDDLKAKGAAKAFNLKRVLVRSFPIDKPAIVTLVDVAQRELTTFTGEEMATVGRALEPYDVIGAIDVRTVLRGLDFEPGARRLAELGPPQKSRKLNKRGRPLKITADLLVQGSCGISKPFGEAAKLKAYLDRRDWTRLRRRIESDAKSLYALYEYGRLHRAVRLRWCFLDELLLAPWVYEDEPWLSDLIHAAMDHELELEIVAGRAPEWSEPWARGVRCMARPISEYSGVLVTDDGHVIDDRDVQLARIRGSKLM